MDVSHYARCARADQQLHHLCVTGFVCHQTARPYRSGLRAGFGRIDGLSIPSNRLRRISYAFRMTLQLGDVTCKPCAEAALFVADEFEVIFLDAVTEAELELQDNFGPLKVASDVFEGTITNETAPAFAPVRKASSPLPLPQLALRHIPHENASSGCTIAHVRKVLYFRFG